MLMQSDRGSPFSEPPRTKYNFLSFGAGVQSSTLALMAAKGLIGPMPDAAIFSDTQAEPVHVYDWLSWITKQLPFPVYVVSKGSLTEDSLKLHPRKDGKGMYAKTLIPAFIKNADGTKGIMGRKCTYDYKVMEITKKAKELAGIKRAQKNVTVTQWIGISWDEMQRMKDSRLDWCYMRWPLIERRMTREDCIAWMAENGYPRPPRSACFYCPFHSNDEWRRMKEQDPLDFQSAVRFEKDLQRTMSMTGGNSLMNGVPFLHSSLVPLDQVDLLTDIEKGQGVFDFQSECEGMCGI